MTLTPARKCEAAGLKPSRTAHEVCATRTAAGHGSQLRLTGDNTQCGPSSRVATRASPLSVRHGVPPRTAWVRSANLSKLSRPGAAAWAGAAGDAGPAVRHRIGRGGTRLASRALLAGAAAIVAGCASRVPPPPPATVAVDGRCGAAAGVCLLGVAAPLDDGGGDARLAVRRSERRRDRGVPGPPAIAISPPGAAPGDGGSGWCRGGSPHRGAAGSRTRPEPPLFAGGSGGRPGGGTGDRSRRRCLVAPAGGGDGPRDARACAGIGGAGGPRRPRS